MTSESANEPRADGQELILWAEENQLPNAANAAYVAVIPAVFVSSFAMLMSTAVALGSAGTGLATAATVGAATFAAFLAGLVGGAALAAHRQRRRQTQRRRSMLADERWAALTARMHADRFPGDEHDRFAVWISEVDGKPAVRLLKFALVPVGHGDSAGLFGRLLSRRVGLTIVDDVTLAGDAGIAAVADLAAEISEKAAQMERVSFEECQRDRCEAQERILQFDAALAKHEREAALAQQGVLDTAGVVFGQRAEMTAMQALLARAHAREFPAGDHARFCAWLHLNDDCPNISVLRFEHGGGQDFSTESSRALPADVDLLVLVDAAQDAVLHARQREAEAYDEAVADMLRRETEATLSAIQDGYDDTARADVRSTVAAVRAALSPTSQHR